MSLLVTIRLISLNRCEVTDYRAVERNAGKAGEATH